MALLAALSMTAGLAICFGTAAGMIGMAFGMTAIQSKAPRGVYAFRLASPSDRRPESR